MFAEFPTVLIGMQIEPFTCKNEINAAGVRQNIKTNMKGYSLFETGCTLFNFYIIHYVQ